MLVEPGLQRRRRLAGRVLAPGSQVVAAAVAGKINVSREINVYRVKQKSVIGRLKDNLSE